MPMRPDRIRNVSLPPPKVLVVGDLMTDIIVRPSGPIAVGGDRNATILTRPGGSGANVAAWLAAEGASVVFAGRVGRADAAEQHGLLARCGVQPVLGIDDVLPTGSTVTILSPDGERSFYTDRGANDSLSAADLPESLLEGVAVIHISSYALFSEGPRAATVRLVDRARRHSIPISFDAASHSRLAEVGADSFFKLTDGTEWLFANAAEAAELTGEVDAERQIAALQTRAANIILKLGAAGAVASIAGGRDRLTYAAPPIDAFDTTGAGDAFVAGFLAANLRGESAEAQLERAVMAGSRAATILGGRPPPHFMHGRSEPKGAESSDTAP